MKFYQRDIEAIVDSFLERLEWIKTLQDIEKLHGQDLPLIGGDHIEFSLKPSNENTHTHTMSYVKPQHGIPLEVKINPMLNYTDITLKMIGVLPRYQPFGGDRFGNTMQSRRFSGIDIAIMKRDLAAIKSN